MPQVPDPCPRPEARSPGGGAQATWPSPPPSGGGRGWGAVRGRGAGRGNRGSPREGPAQLRAGCVQKATCSFLGCLRLLKHTYGHTPGTATPTHAAQSLPGWGLGGCRQPKRSALRTLPQPLFATGSAPFILPHPTPSDLDTPTVSPAALGTLIQSHSHNYPLPQTICSSPTLSCSRVRPHPSAGSPH